VRAIQNLRLTPVHFHIQHDQTIGGVDKFKQWNTGNRRTGMGVVSAINFFVMSVSK